VEYLKIHEEAWVVKIADDSNEFKTHRLVWDGMDSQHDLAEA